MYVPWICTGECIQQLIFIYNLPLLILFKYMYHDNNWWYKQSIDVEFFFELLSKTLKLLDLTQLFNTIQEENDSHTG